MKSRYLKILLIAVLLAAALAGGYFLGAAGRHEMPAEEGSTSSAEQATRYTCGMHPFIVQDEPGLCPICGMKLTPLKAGAAEASQVAAIERKVKYWRSPMDPTYVRDEPGKDAMGHDLVAVYEEAQSGAGAVIIDPVTIQNMGVRTATAGREDLHREIRALGRIGYEESAQYKVNSKVTGWIERLYVNQTGQEVKKGQPLLEIYSPELVSAQKEYLLALGHRSELAESSFAEIGTGAQRLVDAARQRLRYWDISEEQITHLERTKEVSKNLTLYAPFDGIVTEKSAFEGMNIAAGTDLMQISDISRVWVYADIFEFELPWIALGQTAAVEIPYAVDRVLRGKVDYIYPFVEPRTRTVQLRIELPNPDLELKPEMFVNVRLRTESAHDVLVIPVDAVLSSGTGRHVFVDLGQGRFEPRDIRVGLQGDGGMIQVLDGIREGEMVVTSAQFMLDSESKLREAVQKMMAPKSPSDQAGPEDGRKEEKSEVHSGAAMDEKSKKENLEDLF